MTTTAKLSETDLMQFTGSEHWYRHPLNRDVTYTDGAKYVADQAGAYWLLDIIALLQRSNKRIASKRFQVWRLSIRLDRTATLTCENGKNKIAYTQELEFTDFPAPGITLWYANNVIYLPNEH